jgi:hypothetical protein
MVFDVNQTFLGTDSDLTVTSIRLGASNRPKVDL